MAISAASTMRRPITKIPVAVVLEQHRVAFAANDGLQLSRAAPAAALKRRPRHLRWRKERAYQHRDDLKIKGNDLLTGPQLVAIHLSRRTNVAPYPHARRVGL